MTGPDRAAIGRGIAVGARQAAKALRSGRALRCWAAEDADPRITEPVRLLCAELGVEFCKADTMRNLGHACGIAVGCAVCAELTTDKRKLSE